ncbi:hypothetical protein POM88_054471 [Heracleum sosnowskyi]|uniref:Uncharacterized protein n=1 Tax=Heracleum sosnowskyi TaxID=360622 RepID=A0AAD8GMA3_9APIA|nr:hypothetical protein POM88_054471 [Heracleum sosnowskyi]
MACVSKFMKLLTPEECVSNEMVLPDEVFEKYAHRIPIVLYPYDGWSFVNDHFPGRNPVDKVVPPFYFIDNIAAMIPNLVEYVLSDGQPIVGSYCHSECELTGLASLCHILGVFL